MRLRIGTLLQGGKYKIEEVLGQGGFGITYLAVQSGLGRRVAIKEFFLKEHCNRDSNTSHVSIPSEGSLKMVERFKVKFLKEARTIATLHHPNIISIFDVFEENGTAYFVMDLVDNGNLYKKTDNNPLSERETLRYALQISNALDYLHRKNILHLDIKPSNILINKKDEVVLIDFGISKRYDSEGHETSSTPIGISRGYAPLEQYNEGVKKFTPETDIYSLGATIYRMLTGKNPPEASVVNEEGLPFSYENVSRQAWRCVLQMMQPIRKKRPSDMASVLSLLKKWEESVEKSDSLCAVKNSLRGSWNNVFVMPKKQSASSPENSAMERKGGIKFNRIIPFLKRNVIKGGLLSITFSKEHNRLSIARYILGIIFNTVIAIMMLLTLIGGGMQDEGWEYHYDILPQMGLLLTSVLSAYSEWLILRGDSKMFYTLIGSNLIYWLCIATIFSVDSKTGLSYMGLAIVPVLIAWLICSSFSTLIYKLCMERRKHMAS